MTKQTFKEAAEIAAQVEKSGDYRNAARLWGIASTLARKNINQEWCENRADFCRRFGMKYSKRG